TDRPRAGAELTVASRSVAAGAASVDGTMTRKPRRLGLTRAMGRCGSGDAISRRQLTATMLAAAVVTPCCLMEDSRGSAVSPPPDDPSMPRHLRAPARARPVGPRRDSVMPDPCRRPALGCARLCVAVVHPASRHLRALSVIPLRPGGSAHSAK